MLIKNRHKGPSSGRSKEPTFSQLKKLVINNALSKYTYKHKFKENDSLNWGFGAEAEFFLVLLFLLQIHLEDPAYVILSFPFLSAPASDASPAAAAYKYTHFESTFFFCCCLQLA